MTRSARIPVLAAPQFDPGAGRIALDLPEGLTIAEIIAATLPGMTPADHARIRVALVAPAGSAMVLPAHWARVRPKPGVRVVIRVVAGKNALRSILQIVVSIAAVALGTMFGPAVGALFGGGATATAIGGALVSLGVNVIGALLINALIPPVKPDNERRNSYSISGWRNRMDPDGAIPVVLGGLRYAPPFIASSWTEIVGDWQYIRAAFLFGEGPVELSDFRIGDTSIDEYDEVEIETRSGLPDDAPLTLYPRQIVEEQIGVELTRPLPRDDLGEIIKGDPAEETPVVRTTGVDASGASIILAFPGGLIQFDNKGRKRSYTVKVRIEQRRVQDEDWLPVTDLEMSAQKVESFYRQHSWTFPTRGRWQVRLTMLTDEVDNSQIQSRTVWAALQTHRPEYPVAMDRPLAMVAVRVKATHQLSGSLDNFSAMAKRVCLDWDAASSTWIARESSNPASLYRYVLQCSANPKPVPDSGIDLQQLQDWHEFCTLHGLAYNRVQDQTGTTQREVLTEIAAAGRASPRHDGSRWGVVIDRPATLIVDHVNPRNSWDFSCRRSYFEPPHAFIVKFQDETNDFKEAQRIIRWPGYVGPITLTETLELPGITDPAVVWREARRRMYEALHRPDTYEATQDGSLRVATRGDTVMLSQDTLTRVQMAARVRSVTGNLIELDDVATMVADRVYAIRFRVYAQTEPHETPDTIGTSTVRNVVTLPGQSLILTVIGPGPLPAPGDLVQFGEAGRDSLPVVITAIEATEDQCAILRAVDAAPIIEELLAVDVIPEWSGRVGAEIGESLLQPPMPRFTQILSGVAGTDDAGAVVFQIEPGSGATATASFQIGHRPGTSGPWTEFLIPAANGGGRLTSYPQLAEIQLRARAVSASGIEGPWTDPITLTIGGSDAPIPLTLDAAAINVTTLLGGALIQFATGSDANTTQVQVYRSTSAVLDREADAVGAPWLVGPLQSYSIALGDTTRTNLVTGGGMENPAAWDAGDGWVVSGGLATHTPGDEGALGQAMTLVAGHWYRIGFDVVGRTAGGLTPRLAGGTDSLGTPVSADGSYSDRIEAATGNLRIEFLADEDFDGSLTSVTVWLQTGGSLAPGLHHIWLEPQNDDGIPGPISGPITVVIA